MKKTHALLLSTFCAFFCVSGFAQNQKDAWNALLDSIVISADRYSSPIKMKDNGSMSLDMRMMDDMPKILGNADPVRYMQMMPGISTNAEYQSGIHIQGSENSHNIISLGGVPIYNVNHLLGFFSIFNSSHFKTMEVHKTPSSAAFPGRIGGEVDVVPSYEMLDSTDGEFTAGLISSQGTVRAKLGPRTSLAASLRASYLNLLYDRWLNIEGMDISYSFFDANASLVHHIDPSNTLALDFYGGRDTGGFHESDYIADMGADWGNLAGSIRWLYSKGGVKAENMLYVTSYSNDFRLDLQDTDYRLISGITDAGLKSRVDIGRWYAGVDATCHIIQPQKMRSEGGFNMSSGDVPRKRSFEGALYCGVAQPLSPHIVLDAGLRGSIFVSGQDVYGAVDPSVSLAYDKGSFRIWTGYSLRHQYLFQTGFSDAGLPTEFWMPCGGANAPQYAHNLSAGASVYLAGRRYRISADVFYKRLFHQIEYSGSILDYVNQKYDIDSHLIHGRGENYGFSLMLNKCTGRLTGWISYAYTHTRRVFNEYGTSDSYPSDHDRPHEANAVVTYSWPGHWSVGGCLVYASGTPFTAPVSLSIINGNVIAQYGRHNGARLGSYMRADISVNYRWHPPFAEECSLNLSLYNTAGKDNELFYRIKRRRNGAFAYRPVSFIIDILPSISFYCRF